MEINNFNPENVGKYTCVAANTMGSSSKDVSLNISQTPPEFDPPEPESMKKNISESLNLTCEVSAYPLVKKFVSFSLTRYKNIFPTRLAFLGRRTSKVQSSKMVQTS